MANEKLEEMKGRVKEAAGDVTDNDDLKREGKDKVGDVADKVKDAID